MKNAYLTLIGMLVRMAVVYVLGALASHLSPTMYNVVNETITKAGGLETVIGGIAATVGVVLLSIYLKLRERLHLNIAIMAPRGTNAADVAAIADSKSVMSVLSSPSPIK